MIQNRNTIGRETAKSYFVRSTSLPSKQQWHNIIDAAVNIKDDLNLEQSDIEGLEDDLEKKLDKDQLAENINLIKDKVEALIDEKTAELTKAIENATSKNYVQQIDDFTADDCAVGTVAQYVGDDDEAANYFAGFFYRKVKDNDPTAEPGTTTGDPIALGNPKTTQITIAGETYLTNYTGSSGSTYDPHTRLMKYKAAGREYFAVAIGSDRVTDTDAPHDLTVTNDFPYLYPLAIDTQTGEQFPIEQQGIDTIIDGKTCNGASTTSASFDIAVRQSDNAAFMLIRYTYSTTNGDSKQLIVTVPAYEDGLYNTANAFDLKITWRDAQSLEVADAVTVTPNYKTRNGSSPAWKMIPVSPLFLDE